MIQPGPVARMGAGWVKRSLVRYAVPLGFGVLCLLFSWASGLRWEFLADEVVSRLGRNALLVLSLILPVTAGLGLNFSIVIGAMAGQLGLITVTHLRLGGPAGLALAAGIATPLAVLLGFAAGAVLNRAKGKEMIASMILSFFSDGLYQLLLLFMVGGLIPVIDPDLILESGVGVRATIDLQAVASALDRLLPIQAGPVSIPGANILVAGLVALGIFLLGKTKLGQDMRAVGQDIHVAEMAGIRVDRVRTSALMLSTVLASWGQIVFLQNISTLNTYYSHDQVGMFSIAALLVGGATVFRATWVNAIVGIFLFHTLFVVAPFAGQNLMASPQIGEFFRVFAAYGIIAATLALNARQRAEGIARRM
ncbi:MAG: ABC transporter permease [Bacillota bacterium]|nr:ABC transporter permease [Bacillota bacterium]